VCEGSIRRVIHPVGVVFKGSGWYINDSRKASPDESRSSSSGTDDKGDKPKDGVKVKDGDKPKTSDVAKAAPTAEKGSGSSSKSGAAEKAVAAASS